MSAQLGPVWASDYIGTDCLLDHLSVAHLHFQQKGQQNNPEQLPNAPQLRVKQGAPWQ